MHWWQPTRHIQLVCVNKIWRTSDSYRHQNTWCVLQNNSSPKKRHKINTNYTLVIHNYLASIYCEGRESIWIVYIIRLTYSHPKNSTLELFHISQTSEVWSAEFMAKTVIYTGRWSTKGYQVTPLIIFMNSAYSNFPLNQTGPC